MSFYEESDAYRAEISVRQREKGRVKYPSPFNPDDWTDDELADHAMMEFHDGQEYVAGMRKRMRELRDENNRLQWQADLFEKLFWESINDERRSNTAI